MIKKRGAIRNLKRILEINRVLKKYKLRRFLIKRKTKDPEKLAINLRKAFEELGPVFIKLGQFLSINYLVIPEIYRREFEKLQDSVPPFPFSKASQIIESEFGKKLDDLFEKIEEKPIAAASLSQVHRAKLHTGEIVVVKVQRPDAQEIIEKDLSALHFFSNRAEGKLKKAGIDIKVILKELEEFLNAELDFEQEAIHADLFRRQELSKYEKIPKVFFNTKKVLVEEYLNGIKISDVSGIHKSGIDKEKVMENLVKSITYHMFYDGLFHGDLHPANMLVLKDGRIGFIDFGVAGKMPENIKQMYLSQYNSIFSNDPEKFIQAHLDANNLKIKDVKKYKKLKAEMTVLFEDYYSKKSERAFDYIFEAYNLLLKYKVPQKNEFLVSTRSTLAVNNLLKRYGLTDKRFEPLLKQMIMTQNLPFKDAIGPAILEMDGKRGDVGKDVAPDFQKMLAGFQNGFGNQNFNLDKGGFIQPMMMVNGFMDNIGNRISHVETNIEDKLKKLEKRAVKVSKIFGWAFLSALIILGVVFYNRLVAIVNGNTLWIQIAIGIMALLLLVDIMRLKVNGGDKK
ncbi:AarF/ABC1/UbiB kinase family protein [Candidatus Pacearchaeota archaeon]|nr:AarF/ABC1/UbiB kinase family protein [Candidatus Pacearchaeota archaeon]